MPEWPGPVGSAGPRPASTDDLTHVPLLAGYGVTVPVAGSDLAGLPSQSPAVARSAHAVPRVSPVNSLLVVDSGRVRVVEPTVSCQPVAPAGAWVGSFTVRVVPFSSKEGFLGAIIGTAVPVVAGPMAVTLEPLVVDTVAAASPSE